MTDNANSDPPASAPLPPASAPAAPVAPSVAPPPGLAAAPGLAGLGMAGWLLAAVVAALSVASLTVALLGQQKVKALEQELVRRQADSQGQAIEARSLARQAQELAQSAEAKVTLMEARVAEASLQRSQLEELIQQLSRSRDENVLADLDAALRVAVQQSTLTGSAEPLVAALRQAEERLARLSQPRVERVRRAVARDLDRVRAAAVADIASLTIKLDEVIRTSDELPLLAQTDRRPAPAAARAGARAGASAPVAGTAVAGAAASSVTGAANPTNPAGPTNPADPADKAWWAWLQQQAGAWSGVVWHELRGLLRVSRVDNQDAMLLAPDQAWFVRENLKLRVLNARLALLSRQFDIVQSDLREVQGLLDRYFDRQARRVQLTQDLLRQVSAQVRATGLPRPDETLAALAAVQAGR